MAFSSPPSTYNTSAPASESRSDTLINPDTYIQGDPPPIPPRGNPPPVVEVRTSKDSYLNLFNFLFVEDFELLFFLDKGNYQYLRCTVYEFWVVKLKIIINLRIY